MAPLTTLGHRPPPGEEWSTTEKMAVCRLPPCTAGPGDELIAVTFRGEFRPDERIDLVYLDAPGALAERHAALPVVGVDYSYTERLDVPAVVE